MHMTHADDSRKQHILDVLRRTGQVIAKDLEPGTGSFGRHDPARPARACLRRALATGSRRRAPRLAALGNSPSFTCATDKKDSSTGGGADGRPGQVVILDVGKDRAPESRVSFPRSWCARVCHRTAPAIAVELVGMRFIESWSLAES